MKRRMRKNGKVKHLLESNEENSYSGKDAVVGDLSDVGVTKE